MGSYISKLERGVPRKKEKHRREAKTGKIKKIRG